MRVQLIPAVEVWNGNHEVTLRISYAVKSRKQITSMQTDNSTLRFWKSISGS
jgi:hypothetical protein